jgi:WD40 repeat protein
VTNSLTVEESNSDYLILSDKFGEIYIKNLSEDFTQPPTILYGHSDPIHMMKISPFNNMIVSADTFGKIKICEFPNIFNFMSVILYKNEDIKFLDFFSNRELLILNSDGEIHIWSLENFELKFKCSLNELLEKEPEIISIIPFGVSKIYIETSKFYYILNRSDNKFVKSLEIEKKNEKIIKSFFLLQKSEVKILGIDEEGKVNYVI